MAQFRTLFVSLAMAAAGLLAWCGGAVAAKPVAVLVEPGMKVISGTPALPDFKIAPALKAAGLEAVELSAAQVADPAQFNADKYSVLVMPYGNAFPKLILDNLLTYRHAGGGLVMSGIPFCHPCEKMRPKGESKGELKWDTLGHSNDYYGYESQGLATGRFRGGVKDAPLLVAPNNPLGLRQAMLPAGAASVTPACYSAAGPKGSVEVIPLVVTQGKADLAPAVLVRHTDARFKGAVDVWLGQVASRLTLEDRYFAQQAMVRGAAWAQLEKGQITRSQFAQVLQAMDRLVPPTPLPEKIDAHFMARPWGDTALPKSPAPAKNMLVVDTNRLKPNEQVALACLQGITSRQSPRFFLKGAATDQFWLDWHKELGAMQSYEKVKDWTTLFARYRSEIKGAVVPDETLYRGTVLAVNVAACEDLIVADEALAKKLGLTIKVDLRGRFKTYLEGMDWVWKTYGAKLNPFVTGSLHPKVLATGPTAYLVEFKALTFWVSGFRDQYEYRDQGADMLEELRQMNVILGQMPPTGIVLGFTSGPGESGLGEVEGVNLASANGKGLVCSDYFRNAPVWSGVQIRQLTAPAPLAPLTLDESKIYIAFNTSDGDNQCVWQSLMKANFFDKLDQCDFPVAWSIGPPVLDLQPGVAQWYYRHARKGDEFLADVSGLFYMMPPNFGQRYKQQDEVWKATDQLLGTYMKHMGMRTLRTHQGGNDKLAIFARDLPFMHSIFADMGNYNWPEGIDKKTYMLGTMPIFHSMVSWRYQKESFWKEIKQQVGSTRPAFVNGFVHLWTYKSADDLVALYNAKPADVVFVSATQLSDLYKEYLKKKSAGR